MSISKEHGLLNGHIKGDVRLALIDDETTRLLLNSYCSITVMCRKGPNFRVKIRIVNMTS